MTSQVHMESMWNMWTPFRGSSGTPDAPIWNSRCIYLDSVVHVDFMWSPCGVHQNHLESMWSSPKSSGVHLEPSGISGGVDIFNSILNMFYYIIEKKVHKLRVEL